MDAPWTPEFEAVELARRFLVEHLPEPDFENLRLGIFTGPDSEWVVNHDLYDDALFDLERLLEEYRFGAAVGVLYARGVRDSIRALKADVKGRAYSQVGISPKVMALLSGSASEFPDRLIYEPDAKIPGQRILGGWWAAQQLDSAFFRGVAALDRLATMLSCIAGVTVDVERMPAFRRDDLKAIKLWDGQPDWAALRALAVSEEFKAVLLVRNGFVHRRRFAMELHGEYRVSRIIPNGRIEEGDGGDPDFHAGMVVALYERVIVPALDHAGKLIASVSVPFDERRV